MTARASNRISRRLLIRSGAAASVLAISGLDAAAALRRGGTLRIATPEGALFDRLVAPGSVYDCLTEIDATGSLRGELASEWSTRQSGKIWAVTLHSDAARHDGRPLVPEDVIAALKPMLGCPGPLERVRSIRKTGPAQLQFALLEPDPQFPLRLADPALSIRTKAQSGSGLYEVVEKGPGNRLKLARVEGHWRAARGGWFDRVELLALSGAGARLDALRMGRVDLAFALRASDRSILLRERRLSASVVRVRLSDRDVPVLVGHSVRLRGLDAQDPLRIAERGFYA